MKRARVGLVVDVAAEAERIVDAVLGTHRNYADYLNLKGMLLLDRGDAAQAVEVFREALEANPEYRAARSNLGHAYLSLQCDGEALEEFETLVRLCPWEPRNRLDLAWWHSARGEHDLAVALLREAGCGDDAPALLLHRLGLEEAAVGCGAGAAKAFRAAAERSEAFAAVYRECGLFAKDPLNPDGVSALRSRLQGNHNRAELLQFHGHVQARYGLAGKARESYEAARAVYPDEAAYHVNMAQVATALGSQAEALEHLSMAVECNPHDPRARMALGFAWSLLGQVNEAVAQFEVAAKLRPGYADVRYNLGLLYCAQERYEEAESELRRAVELNPGYRAARNQLASVLRRLGDNEEALEEYRQTISSGLESSDIHLNAGILHLSLGQIEPAIASLRAATRANPADPLPCYHLGLAYQRRGQRSRARVAWRRFLDLARDCDGPGLGTVSALGRRG
jgi:Flp pilus assembly protein TadD